MATGGNISRRGAPLALVVILIGAWVGLRAATWDSTLAFAKASMELNAADDAARHSGRGAYQGAAAPHSIAYSHYAQHPQYAPPMFPAAMGQPVERVIVRYVYPPGYHHASAQAGAGPYGFGAYPMAPHYAGAGYGQPIANGRHFAQRPMGVDWDLGDIPSSVTRPGNNDGTRFASRQQAPLPFAPGIRTSGPASSQRWMLDVFGFYRQGSSALSIAQGPAPVYGASQIAANLQWRAKPSSSHDPRIYARAYHALVTGGDSEIALGGSARPIGDIPIRLYGELRAAHNPIGNTQIDLRPTAYLATELAPQKLPLGFSLEAYGAGGYVAGDAETYFADGQALLTRELTTIGKSSSRSAIVSVGAGVWGGAQKDAQRLDIGPTLRFDVNIGDLPARVSVDYREQVAGDAEPESGVAATVSTRF